jgi:phosphatidate cytidylyltransferase
MAHPSSASPVGAGRSNLLVRVLTAAVACPILLLLLYFGPLWAWYALVLAGTAVAGWEFFHMTHAGDRFAQLFGAGLCVVVSLVLWFRTDSGLTLLTLMLLLPLAAMLLALARLGDIQTAAARMAATVFGPVWIGMLTCIALVRRDTGSVGTGYVVLTLMYAWFADTTAYFAGRRFGRHKLYEAVSPKKTVEGFIGGLAGAALGGLSAHFWYLRGIQLEEALGLALLIGALGQAGDLGESLLKRAVGVKDSGEIVPGHGGILDRIDALFVTSALVYLYTRWKQ